MLQPQLQQHESWLWSVLSCCGHDHYGGSHDNNGSCHDDHSSSHDDNGGSHHNHGGCDHDHCGSASLHQFQRMPPGAWPSRVLLL
jgi:hypothetical protein